MKRIRLSVLRIKTCAALNGVEESTAPDRLAVPAIPLCGGIGLAPANTVRPTKMHTAPKLAISLPIRTPLKDVVPIFSRSFLHQCECPDRTAGRHFGRRV